MHRVSGKFLTFLLTFGGSVWLQNSSKNYKYISHGSMFMSVEVYGRNLSFCYQCKKNEVQLVIFLSHMKIYAENNNAENGVVMRVE